MQFYPNCDDEQRVGDIVRDPDGHVGRITEIEGGRYHANVTVDFGAAVRGYFYPASLSKVA